MLPINIANKHATRVVSRCVIPTLSRLQALKKRILSVLKAIPIKVTKDFEFYKNLELPSRSFDLGKLESEQL